MKTHWTISLLVILFVVSGMGLGGESETPETSENISYFRQIRPLLQRRCQGCHQPASRQGDLDLTRYDAFRKGGKSGAGFQPADSQNSLVMAYLLGDRQPRMPLGQSPLTDDEIGWFRSWIEAGAKDDTPVELTGSPAAEVPIYRLPPVITALAFSPNGTLLAVSGNREVLLHRSDGSGIQARLIGVSDRIQSLAFSPDGETLMAAGGNPARFGEVQFWDVASQRLKNSTVACTDTLFGASLSPDGSRVAFGCSDHTVRILDAAAGTELLKMTHHENWVLGTVFGIDGKRIVSVGRDRAAKLADASSGAFLENLNPLRGELTALARHPSRDAVVFGGEDRIPYFYLMDRPRKLIVGDDATFLREFEMQPAEIFTIAFGPDGKNIAVAGSNPEIPIYQVDTGARVATCKAGDGGAYALSFHPDGRQLAVGGFDGVVRIFATDSGILLREFVPVPLETSSASAG